MKVLVTGGGGFLGSAIVRMLIERGTELLPELGPAGLLFVAEGAFDALAKAGQRGVGAAAEQQDEQGGDAQQRQANDEKEC